jgi:stearoyl-CoA desaturase (delta-9 desaturase)
MRSPDQLPSRTPALAAASHAEPLALPAAVERGNFLWPYAISFIAVHAAAALAVLPWLFTWAGLAAFVLGVLVFGEGIILGYHRLLAHGSFAVPKWIEHVLVVLAICSMQDTPVRWVTAHRVHHKYSDEQADPHSPHVGWFWGHIGWLCYRNPAIHGSIPFGAYAHDLLRDPFYRRLEKSFWLSFYIFFAQIGLYLAAGFLVGWIGSGTAMGGLQGAASLLVWGVLLRTVATWHITWSVNSFVHKFGYRNYATADDSRNNWVLAVFASGEGWHNNHHHDPASASNQHRWWELDASFAVVWILERLGLATKVIRPRSRRRAARWAVNGEKAEAAD